MKKIILIALLAGYGSCFAQKKGDMLEFKQHISKQLTLQKAATGSVFALYNVWGDVKVEGYNGNQVLIEIDQTIKAEDSEAMARAKQEFKLGFDQKTDTITVYTAEPYDSRPHQWNGNDRRNNNQLHYIVKLEYTVKVPFDMNIKVATVNDGKMAVSNVYGKLKVTNVNGPVSIANAKSTTDARTVNGDVTVNYLTNPVEASSYSTINGKIEVLYKPNLAANVQFKSMNGEFYTDFNETEILPTEVVKTETKNKNGTTYKLNKDTQIRIGTGGKLFKFETLNGNIYVKKA